jgi:hypothetical protein
MLTYADVVLAYADVCRRVLAFLMRLHAIGMLTCADVC